MTIIIAGAGEVGSHLAKLLSSEDQDIVIVDNDSKRLASLDSYNLLTVEGKPTSFKALKKAGAEKCDLFIAVTPYETSNVTACSIAKACGAKRTLARIDSYEYLKTEHDEFFKSIGVDERIYPEFLAAQGISIALDKSWVRNWFELHQGRLIVIGVKLRESAKIVGLPLKDLYFLSGYAHISAIKRKHETIIPRGDDIIQTNDIAYITTTPEYVNNILELSGKKAVDIKRVLVMGGSRIAIQTAYIVGDKYKITIIENDLERARELSETVPDCTIIHGDARDVDTLQDAGVSDYDAFVALTESSETNILGCLTAKEYGVPKTIAEIENIQFISEAEGLNIGTVINKKLLASSKIFQMLLERDSSTAKFLSLADAEVAELTAKEGSKITRSKVKDLDLSSNMTIGGLIRDDKGYLVSGNTQIQAGDHVVVVCLAGAIHKIEKLFN